MKIKNIKNLFLLISAALLLIFLSSFISALTVAVPSDLSLYPGQVLDTGFDIMNTIQGSSDVTLEAQFLEGSEIVSFTKGNIFEVPGESAMPVFVRLKIPTNAPVGVLYPVKIIFKTVSEGTGSGSISFAEDVVKSFNVRVVDESTVNVIPEEKPTAQERVSVFSNVWFWIILIIIIIVIVLWLVFKKRYGNGK